MGNKTNIAISIIMPSLNVAQYIRQCIDSVLAQTLQELEVLCIDAGSTDGTLEVLEEYARQDNRIHVIISDKRSYGYQVNLGIQMARGEYIGIVETDDYIDEAMYQVLYSFAVPNRPDYIKSGYIPFAEGKNQKYECPIDRTYLKEIFNELIDLNSERKKGVLDLNHIWTGIYRKKFLLEKEIKLHETPGASYQDTSFSLLVGLLADTAIYIQESYYHYRVDNANSSVRSSAKWKCVIEEFRYLEEELKKRNRYISEVKAMVKQEKLAGYWWNAVRLPQTERELFLSEIQEEMRSFQLQPSYSNMDDAGKKIVEMLTDNIVVKNYVAEQRELQNRVKDLIRQISTGKRFVLVGAGRLGKNFMRLQEILRKKFIQSVADNNEGRQGTLWNQYTLLSVTEAVNQSIDYSFIIANKYNSEELQEQLIGLGIHVDKILTFTTLLHEENMVRIAAQMDC